MFIFQPSLQQHNQSSTTQPVKPYGTRSQERKLMHDFEDHDFQDCAAEQRPAKKHTTKLNRNPVIRPALPGCSAQMFFPEWVPSQPDKSAALLANPQITPAKSSVKGPKGSQRVPRNNRDE